MTRLGLSCLSVKFLRAIVRKYAVEVTVGFKHLWRGIHFKINLMITQS